MGQVLKLRVMMFSILLSFLVLPAFGQTGEVSGRVWEDQNGNGIQDNMEPGIVVTVDLNDSQGVNVSSITTSPTGAYDFTALPAGDYQVVVDASTIPAAFTQTYDNDGLATPNSVTFPLPAGSSAAGIDFGYIGPAEVTGRVWEDQNGDGIQDEFEPGIAVEVFLNDDLGGLVSSQTTSPNGFYYFEGLPPGDYQVVVNDTQIPAAYTQTFDNDGLNTPHAVTFPLPAGSSAAGIDFGYIGPAEVTGRVWEDQNGDGIQDEFEPGIAVEVFLNDDLGGLVSSQTTSPNGFYYFDGLPPGDYQVVVNDTQIPAAYTQTFDSDGLNTPHSVTFPLPAGGSVAGIDFGYIGPAEVTGRVWEDPNGDGIQDEFEPGIAVQVFLNDSQGGLVSSQTTSPNGFYYFDGLPPGDYQVVVNSALLPSAFTQTYDSDGLNTPHAVTFPLPAGGSVAGIDFGYIGPAEVTGRVWEDQNGDEIQDESEPGISVEVFLNDSEGNLISSQTTSPSGGYFYFEGLLPGDYQVVVHDTQLPDAFTQTFDSDGLNTPHAVTFPLPAGGSVAGIDFGYIGPAEVTGRVWEDQNGDGIQDESEPGISVEVALNDSEGNLISSQITSPSGGYYYFEGLPPGDYQVVVDDTQLPNAFTQTFDSDGLNTPHAVTFPVPAGGSVAGIDFGYIGPAVISGVVWEDLDGDGLEEPGESGIPANVTLQDSTGAVIASLTTSSHGFFTFDDILPGDYMVVVDDLLLPPALTPTFDPDGIETPHQASFPVAAGAEAALINFGYGPSAIFDGPVAYWPLDEGVGSTVGDATDNGYHGVFVSGPTWDPAFLGTGLSFDGQSDAVSVSMAPLLDAPVHLTMAAWVKHSSTGAWRSIIDKRDSSQDGYDLYINSSSRLFMRVGSETLTGNTVIADGTWHHVVGVYDGVDLLLYVDGILDAIVAVGPLAIDTAADLRLGENYALGNSFFAGTLDEVRIYDRPLSDLEVLQLYDYRSGDLSDGLQGYWALDAGAGSTAGDSSGNGYNGAVLGSINWGAGQVVGGLAFDGLSTAIDVGPAPLLDAPQALTLAAWIQHPTATGWHSIIDKRDATQIGFDLYVNPASRLFLRVEDRTLTSPGTVADNTWHHVVGVYDGEDLVLYVDGNEVTRSTIGARFINTTNPLRIGENWSLGNSFFAGSLDEVRVYDRALTAGEVQQLFAFSGTP